MPCHSCERDRLLLRHLTSDWLPKRHHPLSAQGYLLKLDFFHAVEPGAAYFGRRALSRKELEDAYGRQAIPSDYMHNLVSLMDLFCLSEVGAIATWVVPYVARRGKCHLILILPLIRSTK